MKPKEKKNKTIVKENHILLFVFFLRKHKVNFWTTIGFLNETAKGHLMMDDSLLTGSTCR